MEKKICSYEALFTVNANLPEEEVRATVDKYVSLIRDNASDVSVNEWGKRRLAYPIRYNNDGFVVLVNFKSEPSFPRELERQLRIANSILRVMITRAKEVPAAPVQEEAPVVAAEATAEATAE